MHELYLKHTCVYIYVDTGLPEGSIDKAVKIMDHVRDVECLLHHIGQKTIIISHSFGGMITMKLLEKQETRAKIIEAVV
jgi:pimeloyl-ACP methyl ester carboxylesterase